MMPSLVIRSIIAEVKRSSDQAERQAMNATEPEILSYASGKLTAYTFTLALLHLALVDIIAYENDHNITVLDFGGENNPEGEGA
jgi:hypothetical protein